MGVRVCNFVVYAGRGGSRGQHSSESPNQDSINYTSARHMPDWIANNAITTVHSMDIPMGKTTRAGVAQACRCTRVHYMHARPCL